MYPYRANNLSFKMTTEGTEQLARTCSRLGVLRGDVLEYLVRTYADSVTNADIELERLAREASGH